MRSTSAPLMRLAAASITALTVASSVVGAQRADDRYDDIFRKYSKRYFGVAFDWRHFKAQAMAESELNPKARSRVGARGLMQLMPSTYKLIATKRTEFTSIDDPEFNIAAGILHDRDMWRAWQKQVPDDERHNFMFGSYNAGEGTILRASRTAREKHLDHSRWPSIETVAPTVPRWRYTETLGYVKKIRRNYEGLKKDR
jgi:membrane-bound lytic murein transglycosylase F